MFILLALFAILPDYHLCFSHRIVFFVGAAPPLSLDHSAGRKQPLSVKFRHFCHFSDTFIAAISHIHPELRIFQTHSKFFLLPPGLLLANKWPPMFLTGTSIPTAAAELGLISAFYCSWSSGGSKSTPARHHQLTSRSVCSTPGRWSIRLLRHH